MWHFLVLLATATAIYFSCEWFVNAVEWLGRRLNIGKMAVGTVLAAFGTALPESVVTLVAVTTGSSVASKDIGMGAAMGGPLVLATVAYGVTGVALLTRQRRHSRELAPTAASGRTRGDTDVTGAEVFGEPADAARLAKDQRWFIAVFVVKVALGLVTFSIKPWLGLLFFAGYGVYCWREMRGGHGEENDNPEPLKLHPKAAIPAAWAVAIQTLGALVVIFFASELFVHQLTVVGPILGLSSTVTALLLAPIATELPEIMNAIIWIRQGKTQLALANISGAMMIQATVPSGLGLLFTDWRFDTPLLVSGVVTMVAIVYLLATLRARRFTPARLAVTGLLYIAFGTALVPMVT